MNNRVRRGPGRIGRCVFLIKKLLLDRLHQRSRSLAYPDANEDVAGFVILQDPICLHESFPVSVALENVRQARDPAPQSLRRKDASTCRAEKGGSLHKV